MVDTAKQIASITPKRREQIHISGVNMLEECGKRFEFRYVLGIRRPPGAWILRGNAVHHSVATSLEHKIHKGELPERKEVIGACETEFDRLKAATPIELQPDEKRDGKTLETVLAETRDESLDLSGLHYDEAAPGIRAKIVNRKFSIDMDGWLRRRAKELHASADAEQDRYAAAILRSEARALNAASRAGMDLAGEQDIVEMISTDLQPSGSLELKQSGGPDPVRQRLHIRDTKTSTKSPTKSRMDGSDKNGIADDSDQLTTYALASLVFDKKLPDLMVLDYLIRTPARHDLKYIPTKTTRDLTDVNVFLNRFANAVHAYRRGIFVPAKADWWGCSEQYCGYANMCPYFKRPKQIVVTKDSPTLVKKISET